MNAARKSLVARMVLLLVGLWAVAGCEKKDPVMQDIDASNLRNLASFWTRATAQNRGKPPASEAEFKKYIHSMPPDQLAAMKIEDVDKLFISERDGKPYVILYDKTITGSEGRVMGHEQEGKNGKRLVALSFGQVREVDATEFEKLVPAGKKP